MFMLAQKYMKWDHASRFFSVRLIKCKQNETDHVKCTVVMQFSYLVFPITNIDELNMQRNSSNSLTFGEIFQNAFGRGWQVPHLHAHFICMCSMLAVRLLYLVD